MRKDWGSITTSIQSQLSSLSKPRYSLDQVIHQGLFFMAKELYGLTAVERTDITILHKDVKVFELLEEGGTALGLVFLDLLQRPSKRSQPGAAGNGVQITAGMCVQIMNRSSNLNL